MLKVKVISSPLPKYLYVRKLKRAFLINHCVVLYQILYESFSVHVNLLT